MDVQKFLSWLEQRHAQKNPGESNIRAIIYHVRNFGKTGVGKRNPKPARFEKFLNHPMNKLSPASVVVYNRTFLRLYNKYVDDLFQKISTQRNEPPKQRKPLKPIALAKPKPPAPAPPPLPVKSWWGGYRLTFVFAPNGKGISVGCKEYPDLTAQGDTLLDACRRLTELMIDLYG